MDYGEYVVKAMEAGANMDSNGNIQHSAASIQTMLNNQEQLRLNEFRQPTIPVYGNPTSFWDIFGLR